MQATISQAAQEQFAMIVQQGLIIGVEMARKAIGEKNVKFFEDAIVDQERMLAVGIKNITERVSFEVWRTRAREFDFNSNIAKYDDSGKIRELNDLVMDEYALEYYTNYVVPNFDMPISELEIAAAKSIAGVRDMINYMIEGLTEDDQNDLNIIIDTVADKVNHASTSELLDVITPKV